METVLGLVGGIVLFLYAISKLSGHIREWADERMKAFVARFTRNILTAIITGIVVTVLLKSSSAAIIITIVLVGEGVVTFRQSLGIVLGANIGTTIASQIMALDVAEYAPVALAAGFALFILFERPLIHRVGTVIFYFGMIFFGLLTMENAVEPLKSHDYFKELIASFENPISGALAGAGISAVIQSSSATVALAITLAKQSLITLPAAIAVMIGAELGTCADTLLATARSNRQAVKTGLFHFSFNLLSIVIGLALFVPFVSLVEYLAAGSQVKQQIAHAHLIFNLLGVAAIAGFLPWIERALNRLLPDTDSSPFDAQPA
ncbi:MAG TPA: Na/Pi symporter [Pyrinomonadaceae bacterium]|nr:Na/Pi symporter [Pyrinomonadaceae bacterium]